MSEIQDSLNQLLHVITKANDNESIEFHYLVERNSANQMANDCGDLILHVAAERNRVSIMFGERFDINVHDTRKTLIEVTDKTYEFLQGINALATASNRCTKMDVLTLFLNIIHRECGKDNQMTAEKLISFQYPLWQVVTLGNAEVIEHMIMRGCSVDDCHPVKKFTALSKAVNRMNLEIVKVLIKYHADVDVVDANGNLPIAYYDHCYCSEKQQPEIIKILLDNSKLLKVFPQERLLQQLKGVFKNGTKEVVQMVIEYRLDVFNVKDDQGKTILHYLAENCHSDIFEIMHGRKIDVNVRSTCGDTPIFIAANNSSSHINTFKFLLENGADVNARMRGHFLIHFEFDIPLFALCHCANCSSDKERYSKIIELFLEYDLDIQFVGSSQSTVFDIIIRYKLFYIAELLLAHLVLLQEQGHPVTEYIHHKINSDQLLKNYFDLCKAEIRNIKNNSIDQGLTLYIILVNREEKIFNIYKSHVNSLSKLETLTEKCGLDHAYYGTIKKRICSIARRIELYRKAAPVICQLTKLCIDVNHLVTTKIMDYLNDDDFYNLISVD